MKHGSKVTLDAVVSGTPPPVIVWYHGNAEIPNCPDFVQEHNTATGEIKLTIEEIFVDDQGPYRALAVNKFGKVETSAIIGLEDIEVVEQSDVRCAPRIITPLKPNVINARNPLDFIVEFEAFPPPIIKWYRDERELVPSSVYRITYGYGDSVFHIDELYEEDAGEYEVRIFNDVGEARSAASLIVTGG